MFKCSTATPAPLSSNRRVNCTFTRRRLIAQSIGWLLDFNSHSQMQPLTHVVSTVLLQPDFNLICSMSSTSGRWNHSVPHARLQCVFYEWMRRAASGGWFRLYSLLNACMEFHQFLRVSVVDRPSVYIYVYCICSTWSRNGTRGIMLYVLLSRWLATYTSRVISLKQNDRLITC